MPEIHCLAMLGHRVKFDGCGGSSSWTWGLWVSKKFRSRGFGWVYLTHKFFSSRSFKAILHTNRIEVVLNIYSNCIFCTMRCSSKTWMSMP